MLDDVPENIFVSPTNNLSNYNYNTNTGLGVFRQENKSGHQLKQELKALRSEMANNCGIIRSGSPSIIDKDVVNQLREEVLEDNKQELRQELKESLKREVISSFIEIGTLTKGL